MRSSMKFLLSLILLCCFIINCSAIVYFERHIPKPGHENECYDAESDVYYQKGNYMSWNKKYCGQKICRGSDEKGGTYIDYYTCENVNVSSGCHLEVNLELPYPKCCGKMVCNNSENYDRLTFF